MVHLILVVVDITLSKTRCSDIRTTAGSGSGGGGVLSELMTPVQMSR